LLDGKMMLRILRPTTLQLYILREFAIAFVLALAACTLFMLLGVLFMMAMDYAEYRVTTGQIAMLFPYLLPKPLAYATPLAAMIAATMVFGRFSAENEILAAQAGGAPLRALAFPLVLCSIVLTLFCLWLNQGALNWGWTTIRDEIFKVDKLEFFRNLEKPNNTVSLNIDNGGMVRINWLPHEKVNGGVRRPIHIVYYQNQQAGRAVFARDYSAEYKRGEKSGEFILELTLKDAYDFGHTGQTAPSQNSRPDMSDMQSFGQECTLELKLPPPSSVINIGEARGQKGWLDNYGQAVKIAESEKQRKAFMLQRAADYGAYAVAGTVGDPAAIALAAESYHESRIAAEAIYGQNGSRDRAQAELAECYRKLGLSILPISMMILGIGLGLLVQKSQRLIGFLLGLLVYALLYYPMMIICKEMARAKSAGLWVLFLPNVVLLLLGYALWRAYERGSIGNVSSRLAPILTGGTNLIIIIFKAIQAPFVAVQNVGLGIFRRKTDGYVAGSFILPLLAVILVNAFVLTALDLVEHGNEVIESVIKAGDPLAGAPRSTVEAALDAMSFYSILALERSCDLLPLMILVAGMLCIMALVRNNEHLILKSSGVRLQRAFRPIILTALVFSLGVALLRETVMPQMIMARDYLRPLVYRRCVSPRRPPWRCTLLTRAARRCFSK
jgi:lipopolysaccharide export LptBFGC system permease protein LptF